MSTDSNPKSLSLPPSAGRILGVDPGLNTTGYGVLETTPRGPRVVAAGAISSKAKTSLASRVREIYDGLVAVIAETKPDCVALEELYSHYNQPKTAILMGHARGVICLAATQANAPVAHYAATQIKKILTGAGRAPKTQMQDAIRRELGLAELPEPADVADALAIALCHYHLGRSNTQWLAAQAATPARRGRPVLDLAKLQNARRGEG
jgi:crossover junction endodeoxyribonuclease RuvC